MCGIFGAIGDINLVDLDELSSVMKHRGPDHFSHQRLGLNVLLAHSRLRITDPVPNSDQPMFTSDDQMAIVFNGELYNYKELNHLYNLNAKGDTEVLLALIAKFGIGNVTSKLKGMLAFSVYDKKANKIYLYRDVIGKKPLYYFSRGNMFVFGSEIKFLKQFEPTLDETFLFDILRIGHSFGETTMYQDIKMLQPGSLLIYDIEAQKFEIEHAVMQQSSSIYGYNEFLKRFELAVKRRKELEVPAVSFLSGGVDSSVVSASLTDKNMNFMTFATVENDSEIALAEETSKNLKIDLKIEKQDELAISYVIECLKHYDEPTVDLSYIYSCHLVSKVNKTTKIIFNGEGADELFLGYSRLRVLAFLSLMNQIKLIWPLKLLILVTKNLFSKSRTLQRIDEILKLDFEDAYVRANGDLLTRHEVISLIRSDFVPTFNNIDRHWYRTASEFTQNKYNKLILADFFIGLRGGLMKKVDISTMKYGKEARSPFLDQDLAIWALYSNIYVRGLSFIRKKFVTNLARQIANKNLGKSKKIGFSTKYIKFINQFGGQISDIGLDPSAYIYKILDHGKVTEFLSEQDNERKAKLIYLFFTINLLYEEFK